MKKYVLYISNFRHSIKLGICYEVLRFALNLLCGYLISFLLQYAMEASKTRTIETVVILITVILISIPCLYFLNMKVKEVQKQDLQSFREFLYHIVISGQLEISSRGEFDIRFSNDVKTISIFCQTTLPNAVGNTVVLLSSTVLLCTNHLQIGLLLFALNLLQLVPTIVYEGWARKIYHNIRSAEEEAENWILEGYHGIKTLKSYRREGWFLTKLHRLYHNEYQCGKRAEQTGTVENIIFEAVNSILLYGTYVLLGIYILIDKLSVMKAPVLIVLSGYLFQSMNSVYLFRIGQFKFTEACRRLCWSEKKKPVVSLYEEMIFIKDLKKSYGGKVIFSNYSMTVKPGDKVLVRGGNGTGKSTLLGMILDLIPPDAGEIALSKHLVDSDGIDYRKIAFSLQLEAPLSFTGKDLILTLLQSGSIKKDGKNGIEQTIQGLRLSTELFNRPLSTLSFGERKKLFLAIALSKESELLILDEPTNHLDTNGYAYLFRRISEYRGTLMICSHDERLLLPWDQVIEIGGESNEGQ